MVSRCADMRTLLCSLALASLLLGTAAAEPLNSAAGFGWQGYVDTDLPFSSFVGKDHTIVLRFLAQYTMAGEGPLVTTSGGGTYTLGIADYRAGGGNAVKLELEIGGTTGFYTIGNPKADCDPKPLQDAWHTLALVRDGNTVKLFLDGERKDADKGGDLKPKASDFAASGNVRLGKKTASDGTQYYGYIDDVAVFDQALTKNQLDDIFKSKRLDKTVSHLKALRAWTFDDKLPDDSALPAAFTHAVTFNKPAYVALVTQHRDSSEDAKLLPLSFQKSTMHLPFEPGVAWSVEQPNEGLASHNGGGGAFSWDFIRDDKKELTCTHGIDNAPTCETKVVAYADGTLTDGCDLGDPPDAAHLDKGCASSAGQLTADGKLIDGYDFAHITDAPDEAAIYLHLDKGSLREAFPNHANGFKSPAANPPAPKLDIKVKTGQWIARAGTRGKNNCHLHFSVGRDTLVTTPVAFTNYELWDPIFKRWVAIDKGIPQAGQTVRNPPKPGH